jgi:hypothetical protein
MRAGKKTAWWNLSANNCRLTERKGESDENEWIPSHPQFYDKTNIVVPKK